MKYNYLIHLILFTFLFSCESRKTKQQTKTVEISEVSQLDTLTTKDLSLKIYFEKSKVRNSDSLLVTLVLKNKSSKTGIVIFDKPRINSIYAFVYNEKTKESILKYGNKSVLLSTGFNEKERLESFDTIKPNQFIKRTHYLSDFVIYNTEDNHLPKGKYNCSFWLEQLKSNEVLFEIY